MKKLPNEKIKEIEELKAKVVTLYNEENYYNAMQLAAKLALNGTYGGLANKHFACFNLNVAGSVTAMGRDLIQYMETCNDQYWYNEWHLDLALHNKLGLSGVTQITPDKPVSVYIDTDSVDAKTLIRTESGNYTIEELYNLCGPNGSAGTTMTGHESVKCDLKILNWNNDLYWAGVKRIIKHRVKKTKWRLTTISGKQIDVTNDHSLIVFRNGEKLEVKPIDVLKTDKVVTLYDCIGAWAIDGFLKSLSWKYVDIQNIEEIGEFDEYVYDIEVDDDTHTFIANDILVHNSLFVSFKPGMDSCNWSGDPIEFIHLMDQNRLAHYFKNKLEEYAARFGVKNIQDFERERINKSILFMEKKRYIQNVVWEDGFEYDDMSYLYSKGIELVKRSTPVFVRDKVMAIVKYLFTRGEQANSQELLKLMREIKNQFKLSNIEDISMSTGCNNYSQKVIDDQHKLQLVSGTHIGVKAAAFHNFLLNNSKGMKSKYSTVKTGSKIKYYYTTDPRCPVFGYPYGQFPTEFAPTIDMDLQFEKTVLPIVNALIREMGIQEMNSRLTMNLSLF